MTNFESSRLWATSLGDAAIFSCEESSERNMLREAYMKFREKASILARQIEYDLPELTIHDVTHLDALWILADLIGGHHLSFTPAEAFVFGGAVLIHDLGMALAVYTHGRDELRSHPMWDDTVVVILRDQLGRTPSPDEIVSLTHETEQAVVRKILRFLHAEKAEQLALVSWHDFVGREEFYLIEDKELRNQYGALIGKIAYSHGLSANELSNEFSVVMGAPGSLPPTWTIDPLKLACLLRTADAAHLDERRAPRFLRALKNPIGIAAQHWSFQAKLNQPTLVSDRLLFTSNTPFGVQEADSWWLCFDALQIVDRELRSVDDLLADLGRQRFAAAGVRGVDSAKRLAELVPTKEWLPIDAQVKITDVRTLIRTLGGESLYGDNKIIPLRELIQNGADAVRARRLIELRSDEWGEINVIFGCDDNGDWIEVTDSGVGMSAEALCGPFLDFGKSGWNSDIVIKSFPKLLSKGFEPTGKYGIGFFSVFIWGDRICVKSRRYDAALQDTYQLDFSSGLEARPLLRKCSPSDCLKDGGTSIRVWLRKPIDALDFLRSNELPEDLSLSDLCAFIAPSLDVSLYVREQENLKKLAVVSNDWKRMDVQLLVNRLSGGNGLSLKGCRIESLVAKNLREIYDHTGLFVGRACITPKIYGIDSMCEGVVTVGGLRSGTLLSQLYGIVQGDSVTASRFNAKPVVCGAYFAVWCSDQAKLLSVCNDLTQKEKSECAEVIRLFGGDVYSLPIAETCSGWVTAEDIRGRRDLPDEIIILQDAAYYLIRHNDNGCTQDISLMEGVFAVSTGQPGVLQAHFYDYWIDWPNIKEDNWGDWGFYESTLAGALLEAIAYAWGVELEDVIRMSLKSSDEKKYVRDVVLFNGKKIKHSAIIVRKPGFK